MKFSRLQSMNWLMAVAIIFFVASVSSCSKDDDEPVPEVPDTEEPGDNDDDGDDNDPGEGEGEEIDLNSFLPEAGTTIDFAAYAEEDYYEYEYENGRKVFRLGEEWEVSSPLGIDIKRHVVVAEDGVEMRIDPNTGYTTTFNRNSLNRLDQRRTSGLFVWTVETPEIKAEDDYYSGGMLYTSDDLGYAVNAYITYGTAAEREEFEIPEGKLAFRVGSDSDPSSHMLFPTDAGEHEIAIGLVTGEDGNFIVLFALDGEVVATMNLEYGPDEIAGTDFMPVCGTGTRDNIGGPNHIADIYSTLYQKFEYFPEK
ncbi:MAG TPA: hypothetical protein VKZ54_12080 [Membranihabitans sp.]|nr:hypothetical protein [Membranihabitans sp.]